jgi:hypothetical protein
MCEAEYSRYISCAVAAGIFYYILMESSKWEN